VKEEHEMQHTVSVSLVALAVAGLVVGWPAAGLAKPPCGAGHAGPSLERHIEALDLDEETATAAFEIIDGSKPEHRALRQQLRQAHERMRELLSQNPPDEALVMAQAESIGALETEASKIRHRTLLRVQALLTAEQRTRLLDAVEHEHPRSPRGHRHEGTR
jgi:Spy/CpxP family protein refolding chaperone